MVPCDVDLVDFIVKNYRSAAKIVEVGVGSYPWVAKIVKNRIPWTDVVVTDVCEEKLKETKSTCPKLEVACDDIGNPSSEIYDGANLIYSIRPPPELIFEIHKVALKAGCDVLIRPLSHEECAFVFLIRDGWQSIQLDKSISYLLRKKVVEDHKICYSSRLNNV